MIRIEKAEEQAPLHLRPGDPIRLRPLTPMGEKFLARQGDLWTVVRVSTAVVCLDMEAGILLSSPTGSHWLKFSDQNVCLIPCPN